MDSISRNILKFCPKKKSTICRSLIIESMTQTHTKALNLVTVLHAPMSIIPHLTCHRPLRIHQLYMHKYQIISTYPFDISHTPTKLVPQFRTPGKKKKIKLINYRGSFNISSNRIFTDHNNIINRTFMLVYLEAAVEFSSSKWPFFIDPSLLVLPLILALCWGLLDSNELFRGFFIDWLHIKLVEGTPV